MVHVYTNDTLEYIGSRKQVAEYIGISISTIHKMGMGKDIPLPHHAKCDYIIVNDVQFQKRYNFKGTPVHKSNVFNVGFETLVKGVKYRITNIETFGKRWIYTWNDDIKIITLGKLKSYNTLYHSLYRHIHS